MCGSVSPVPHAFVVCAVQAVHHRESPGTLFGHIDPPVGLRVFSPQETSCDPQPRDRYRFQVCRIQYEGPAPLVDMERVIVVRVERPSLNTIRVLQAVEGAEACGGALLADLPFDLGGGLLRERPVEPLPGA